MLTLTTLALLALPAADRPVEADVVIRGATLYDGSGRPGQVGDLALKGDRIVAVGAFSVAGPQTNRLAAEHQRTAIIDRLRR